MEERQEGGREGGDRYQRPDGAIGRPDFVEATVFSKESATVMAGYFDRVRTAEQRAAVRQSSQSTRSLLSPTPVRLNTPPPKVGAAGVCAHIHGRAKEGGDVGGCGMQHIAYSM